MQDAPSLAYTMFDLHIRGITSQGLLAWEVPPTTSMGTPAVSSACSMLRWATTEPSSVVKGTHV